MRKEYIIAALIIILAIFRFAFLDQDGHPRPIIGYNIADEAYYISETMYDELRDQNKYPIDFSKKELYWNGSRGFPLTAISLSVIGNTYWGLRIPVVILSLLSILLIFSIIRKRLGLLLASCTALYLLVDFSLLAASRYQNPQIYSYFIFSLILYVFFNLKRTNWQGLMLGFLAVYLVFFNYILEVYISAGLGLFVAIDAVRNRDKAYFISFVSGSAACLFLFIIYLQTKGITFFDYIQIYVSHGGSSDEGNSSIFYKLFAGFVQSFSTNFLRYNLVLLAGTIYLAGYYIYTVIKKRKLERYQILFLPILIALLVQSCFVHSYAYKKLIVYQPLAVIVFAFGFTELLESKIKGTILNISWMFIAIILVPLYVLKITSSSYFWFVQDNEKYSNIPVAGYVLLGFALLLCVSLILKRTKQSYVWITLIMAITSSCFSAYYFINQRSYIYRDTLLSIRPELEDKYILDGFGLTWQFYSGASVGINPVYFFSEKYKQKIAPLRIKALREIPNCIELKKLDAKEVKQLNMTTDSLGKNRDKLFSFGEDFLYRKMLNGNKK